MATQPNMAGRNGASNAHQNQPPPGGSTGGKLRFKPQQSFDVHDNPPEAADGSYFVRFVTKRRVSAKGDPQIVLSHKIIGVADGVEDNERFIGGEPTKFLTFSGEARTARMTKTELLKLQEKTQFDEQILADLKEHGIQSEDDMMPLCEALEAVEQLQVWIQNVPDRKDPNIQRCNIYYDEPVAAMDLGAPDETEEEEPPPAPTRKPAAKAAAKTAARRR